MKLILYIFFFLSSVLALGQDFSLKEEQIRDANNTYLLSSTAFVDKDGFIWYSTGRDGDFYRFDGKHKLKYRFYKNQNNNYDNYYLSSSAWIQDKDDNIWAIKNTKAYIIHPNELKVECLHYPTEGLGLKSSIAMDQLNSLWISNGSSYLIKIAPDRTLLKITHPILEKKKKSISIVKTLDDGRIIAKSGYDLFYIDKKGLHFYGNLKSIDKDISYDFFVFENGKLLAKNSNGFYRYNGVPHKYTSISPLNIQIFNYPYKRNCNLENCEWYDNILYVDSKIFISKKYNLIINQVDRKNNTINTINIQNFRKPPRINYSKYRPNLIWISNYDMLYKLLVIPNQFKQISQLNERRLSTRGILSDSKNNLYIGTYEGLYKLKKDQKEPEKLMIDNKGEELDLFDTMILEKNDSILWATQGHNGIKRVNLITLEKKNLNMQQVHEIVCMKEKSSYEFWLGTNKGLYIFNIKNKTFKPYTDDKKDLGPIHISDLLKTKSGNIWIATEKGLFFKENGTNFINYNSRNKSFGYKDLLTLYEDSRGNLWIGTDGKGIIFLDTKTNKIKNYTRTDGLSNNIVCGIMESKNAMWFATFYGLSRFDKKKQSFTVYYKEDGLSDNEFNLRSAFKKNDSTYYFGGLNGIVEFNPERIGAGRKHTHKIFWYSSEYFSKDQNKNVTNFLERCKKSISLPNDKNYFSAKFSLNELFFCEKNTYFYKIEGLRNNWINAGNSGTVELYGLPPGEYVLRVKGKDAKGVETSNEIAISIRIEQVFFKNPIFISFVLLASIGLVIYIFIARSRKQKKAFEKEKEISELKTSALKAQMNPHFVFNILNNMQSVLILKNEKEVNKYFVAFSKLLRLTLDMSKQEMVSLKDEIEYLTNYLLLNQLQLDNKLVYSIAVEDSIQDVSAIMLPGMLLQPFVENAIIHGLSPKKDKKLKICFKLENDYLVMIVEDNGIGRVASALAHKNKKENYKSWATTIVNDRIKAINDIHRNSIFLEIIDLQNENIPDGTQVILKFRVKTK